MAQQEDKQQEEKWYIPLENSPEVMNTLLSTLGMSPIVSFHDVMSLDPDLLSFIPRPVYALILVAPYNATCLKAVETEDTPRPVYSGFGPGEEIIWYRQTIRNACGLMGLLHAASNGEVVQFIEPGSALDKLRKDAIPLEPTARARLVFDNKVLEAAHAAVGVKGDSTVPAADARIDLHYVAFVKSEQGNLWELDGGRKGPLNRGKLSPEEDVLSEHALDLGIRAFVKREKDAGGKDVRFSLLALAPALD